MGSGKEVGSPHTTYLWQVRAFCKPQLVLNPSAKTLTSKQVFVRRSHDVLGMRGFGGLYEVETGRQSQWVGGVFMQMA